MGSTTATLPLPTLTSASALDAVLHRVIQQDLVPGVFFGAANVNEIIYENQAGAKVYGDESAGKVDAKTTLHLFSQTKLVTCLAALQLIDRDILTLDDPALIAQHLPELTELKILKGYKDEDVSDTDRKPGMEIWEEPKNAITLRMLMSHTAGLAYMFTSEHYPRWNTERPHRKNMLGAHADVEALTFPLVYEPGTSWKYSVSIDWVGLLVARVTGMSLDEYFQKHIFGPCGIKDLTFIPRKDIKERMMTVCTRNPATGRLKTLNAWPMGRTEDEEAIGVHAGGAGLFGTLHDYLVLLQNVMACSPNNANPPTDPLISHKAFNLLFEPTLPIETKFPRDPAVGLADVEDSSLQRHVDFSLRDGGIKPTPTVETRNHSVALSINMVDLDTGRKAGSGNWSGAAKTMFWLDPKSGLVAVCGTQLLVDTPDAAWRDIYNEYERTLYDALKV